MVLYRVFPFKYYIHESFHSHSCMNSCYSFMSCYHRYIGMIDIWLLFSMIDIIPYGINPYVIPMIPLCGNHGFSFCCLVYGYVFLFTISFLSYRSNISKNISQKWKREQTIQLLLPLHHHNQQPTNETTILRRYTRD